MMQGESNPFAFKDSVSRYQTVLIECAEAEDANRPPSTLTTRLQLLIRGRVLLIGHCRTLIGVFPLLIGLRQVLISHPPLLISRCPVLIGRRRCVLHVQQPLSLVQSCSSQFQRRVLPRDMRMSWPRSS